MKKKMEKVRSAALACGVALALALAPMMAFASGGIRTAPTMGSGRAGLHQNLSFYGASVYRGTAATGEQLITGESFLDMICTIGGTVGQYSMAMDSAGGASSVVTTKPAYWAMAIAPQVFVQNGTTSQAPAGCGAGCWCPPFPIRFESGLVGVQSATGHTSLYYVHSSSGSNPGH